MRSSDNGFTLVELLVVISIIALLMSILMPSLGQAREQARTVVCGSKLQQFGVGLMSYITENDAWIPGMNTTGLNVLTQKYRWTGGEPEALHKSNMPVQTTDWMTPIVSLNMSLPKKRADRWWFLWKQFECPSQSRYKYKSILWEDGAEAPDFADFEEKGQWPAASYKMSAHFQYFGETHKRDQIAYYNHPSLKLAITPMTAPRNWEVVHKNYIPKIERIGTPARKLFAGDGTRYLPQALVLDHDISPAPNYFGGFSSSGAWWCGSTAYGVKVGSSMYPSDRKAPVGSQSQGANLRLSYRHGRAKAAINGDATKNTGTMNAVFFDGHVETMTDQNSRKIDYWYPKGGVVTPNKRGQGMTELLGDTSQDFVVP